MALVFQYGSNTSSDRLNTDDRLRGNAESLGTAITEEDFELDFTVWSEGNQCAAGDIVAGQGRKILGVLYNIPDALIDRETSGDRKSLDAIEGRKYERRTIRVVRTDGTPVEEEVITYVVKPGERKPKIKTSLKYCTYILTGLREHEAPDDYIEYIKGRMVANNPDLEEGIQDL